MDGYRISGAPAGSSKNNHAHEGNQISSPHGRREGRQSSHFRNSCPLRTRNCRNQTIPINHRCLQKQNSQSGRYLYASFCRTLELSPLHDANPLETLQNLSSQLLNEAISQQVLYTKSMRVRTVISGLRNLTHIPLGKIAVATIIDIRDPSLVTHLVDVTSSDRHVKFILENVSFFVVRVLRCM